MKGWEANGSGTVHQFDHAIEMTASTRRQKWKRAAYVPKKAIWDFASTTWNGFALLVELPLPEVMRLTGFSKLVKVVKKKKPQESKKDKKEEAKEEEHDFDFTLPAAFESQRKRGHHFVVLWTFDDGRLAMSRIVR